MGVLACLIGLSLLTAAPAEGGSGDLLSALADPDPATREAAADLAMELSPGELDELLAAVEAMPEPRPPALETPLRRAFLHARLREAIEASPASPVTDPGTGRIVARAFLGLGPVFAREAPLLDEPDPRPPAVGLVVGEMVPGFVASAHFRDGDVLMLGGPIDQGDEGMRYVGEWEQLIKLMVDSRPGRPMRFRVLRGGRFIDVRLRPDQRRANAEIGGTWTATADRLAREAAADWDREHAPLFADPAPAAPATRPAAGPGAA